MRTPRNWLVATTLLAATALLAASEAAHADHSPAPLAPTPPLHIALNAAYACEGVLMTVSDLEALQGRAWTALADDGREEIQLHEASRRFAAGIWFTAHSTSGGEAWRRWAGYGKASTTGHHFDGLVRMIRRDGTHITSTPKRLVDGCPMA